MASRHLGLLPTKPEKPTTLLGGLTSFGGAGNNYSMHVRTSSQFRLHLTDSHKSLTAMVRELRKGKYHNGLVLANGGVMTYQYAMCLSDKPRRDGSPFPIDDVLPAVITDVPVPEVDEIADGEARIEV